MHFSYMRVIFAALATAAIAVPGLANAKDISYRAKIDVAKSGGSERRVVKGLVFEDLNQDGKHQSGEPGIPGVMVSNSLDVVVTDADGRYELENRIASGELPPDQAMTVFVTKPAGYEVPLDENNVPQFYYHHIPDGTPLNMRGEPFRFGGLEPSGSLPSRVNFPLIKGEHKKNFKMVFSGDTQTYSNTEIGYLRDTMAKELSEIPDLAAVIIEGDVMGDDLGLFTRYKEVMSVANAPLYLTPGNHDLDFDAETDRNSFDTFKREWGPTDYSFDIGDVHFVILDNVKYPCLDEDNADGVHEGCDDDILSGATYNGVLSAEQLEWLKNDLSYVPKHKLVVLNTHIPLLSFLTQDSGRNTTDNLAELYETVGCARAADGTFPAENCERPVLALYGHIHTTENIRPGETYAGWQTTLGDRAVGTTPFPQIDTGAAAGSWWGGDLDEQRIPTAWQRMGSPKGYYILQFIGNTYVDTYKGSGKPLDAQMSLSILSPTFEDWYHKLQDWIDSEPDITETPPVNINDLPDTHIITTDELAETKLVANVWNGSLDSTVYVSIDGSDPLDMTRTQPGEGEGILVSLDPYQLKQTLQVARYAYVSTSGEERNQGYERFRGSQFGPADPRPETFGTASQHIWTVTMPEDLAEGIHTAKVTTVDLHGRKFHESLVFEVRDERPAPRFRTELFEVTP